MSAAALSRLPATLLNAAFTQMGRGLLWLFGKALRAPVSAAIVVLATTGLFSAGNNALYGQPGQHPAPLFTDQALVTSAAPVPDIQPVITPEPARQAPVQTAPRTQAQPRPMPQMPPIPASSDEITNAHVKAMQEKLAYLGLYQDTADGFYGPNTAAAIRMFEQRRGLTPVGAVTQELLRAVDMADGDQAATTPQQMQMPAVSVPRTQTFATRDSANGQSIESILNQEDGQPQTPTAPAAAQPAPPAAPAADNLTRIAESVASRAPQLPPTRIQSADQAYVEKVQRGLASLGFLAGKIDGVAGADTAKAIRNFEVYYNFEVTGAITPELVDMLVEAGAQI